MDLVARLTTLPFLVASLALAGCTSPEPGDNGTVQPGTGGRGGNSIALYDSEILLLHGDDSVSPSVPVGILHEGSRVTVKQVDGSPLPAWLQASAPTHAAGSYNSTITLTYAPLDPAPHVDQTTLRFTSSDSDGSNAVFTDAHVTAVVEQRLSKSREFVTYTVGMPNPATSVDLVADGGWNGTVYEPWARLTPGAGIGSATLHFDIAADTLAAGGYVNVVDVSVPATRRVKTYRLYLGVDARRLDTDQRALSFSSTSGASRTTRALDVIDTAGLAGHWRLDDDAAWLSASATTGAGNATITLTADATGLADGLYWATLTVSPDAEVSLTNHATVRVAFHVDHTTPANVGVSLQGQAPVGVVASDPLRPWLYGFDPVGADTRMRIWNFHTGALLESRTLNGITASQARVSPDGSLLVLSDTDNRKLLPIPLDPSPVTTNAAWTGMRFVGGAGDFAFARLEGNDVIVWSGGQLLSPVTGAVLATIDFFPDSLGTSRAAMRVSNDGRFGCLVERNGTQSRLWYLALGRRGGEYVAGLADPVALGRAGGDCALDTRGENVYVSTDAAVMRFPFQARSFDRDRALPGAVALNALANGDWYASGGEPRWLHLSAGLDDLGERTLPATRVEGLLSGDETRLFERVTDGGQITAAFRDRAF